MNRASITGLIQFLFLALACLLFPSGSAIQLTLILISILFFGWTWYELDKPGSFSTEGFWLPWVAFLVIGTLSFNRFSTQPIASAEYYRYFWDAIVSAYQLNPFLSTPEQVLSGVPALAGISEQIGITSGISLHPPVAQWFFSFTLHYPVATVSSDWFVYRLEILMTTLYVISSWLLLVLNRNEPDSPRWTIAFMLSPVFLFQGILEVHSGFLAVPWIILGVLLLKRNWFLVSGAAFALAAGSDLMVLILIPFLFSVKMEKRPVFLLFSGFLMASVLIWSPFVLLPGLPDFNFIFKQVHFNEFNSFFPAVWVKVSMWMGIQFSDLFSRVMFFSFFLLSWAVLIFYSVRQKNWKIRLRFGLFGFLLFLLFSPEVQPWMMILPFSVAFVLQIVPLSLGAWFVFSMFTILINNQPYSPDSYWQFRLWEYAIVIPLLVADGVRFLGPFLKSENHEKSIEMTNQQVEPDVQTEHS